MSLITSQGDGQDFKQVPPGTYSAICIGLIDLGIQAGEYEGKRTERKQVLLRWELPTEPMDDGQPMILSAFLTNSLNEKAKLRHWLEAWRGRAFTKDELAGFDLRNIIGKPCMLSVIHNEKDKAKVNAVMALPKGMTVPPMHNKPLIYDVDNPSGDVFAALPGGIQAIITGRVITTPQHANEYVPGVDEMNDDIPF
jgi:hypothetical protein